MVEGGECGEGSHRAAGGLALLTQTPPGPSSLLPKAEGLQAIGESMRWVPTPTVTFPALLCAQPCLVLFSTSHGLTGQVVTVLAIGYFIKKFLSPGWNINATGWNFYCCIHHAKQVPDT